MIPTEANIKLACEEYLQYGQNKGLWYFDRLNSGEIIELRGNTRRRVRLCKRGTWDFFVLKDYRVIFLEIKRRGKRLTKEQLHFGDLVRRQGAQGFIITDIDYLNTILPLD